MSLWPLYVAMLLLLTDFSRPARIIQTQHNGSVITTLVLLWFMRLQNSLAHLGVRRL